MVLKKLIPGFRSGSTKNKVISCIYYTFVGTLVFFGKPFLALSALSYPFVFFYIIDFEKEDPSLSKVLILIILIIITELSLLLLKL